MENIIGGIFGLVIASLIIWTSLVQWKNVSRLKSWKSAGGKIIERGTFRVTHANRSAPAFQHAPLVKYVYRVDGREYTGDAILPRHIQHPEHNTIEWAEQRAASFPDDLTVYYNSENPTDSFLIPVSRKTIYIIMAAGSAVTVISLFLLIIGISRTINPVIPPMSE